MDEKKVEIKTPAATIKKVVPVKPRKPTVNKPTADAIPKASKDASIEKKPIVIPQKAITQDDKDEKKKAKTQLKKLKAKEKAKLKKLIVSEIAKLKAKAKKAKAKKAKKDKAKKAKLKSKLKAKKANAKSKKSKKKQKSKK
ncbi:MAG TPA: hypothetical protein VIH09_12125 [Flavobacterium sp.]|uniref:hypothetical protein n=1 Tax=Flavobacterium sp. TaxID=239 RepID=UPI002F411669